MFKSQIHPLLQMPSRVDAGCLEGSLFIETLLQKISASSLSYHVGTNSPVYASQGDLTNPRPDRKCSHQLSTPGIFKPTVLSDTLHCVRVLHHIWMTCHHFLRKSPDLPTRVHAKSLQLCLNLCNPLDYSPPVSSVHGILLARILEWVALPSSRGSSQPRDWTHDSYVSYTGRFFTTSATWEALTNDTHKFFVLNLPIQVSW